MEPASATDSPTAPPTAIQPAPAAPTSAPPKSNALATTAMWLLAVAGMAGAIYVALGKSKTAANETSRTSFDTAVTAPSVPVIPPGERPEFANWKPPRFTERQADRDALVEFLSTNYEMGDDPTLAAIDAVPRHEFVPEDQVSKAYIDSPLPIPYGQLISQPWVVANMTTQLHLKPDARVLEIGTGSGYQAAVLSYYTKNVYSMEIIRPLGEAAAARLKRLGYDTIQFRIADGFNGWPEAGPFDAIIVTCAAGQIPQPLVDQLKPGGHMVVPVGSAFSQQSMMLVDKSADNTVTTRTWSLGTVKFVPLLEKDPTANGN